MLTAYANSVCSVMHCSQLVTAVRWRARAVNRWQWKQVMTTCHTTTDTTACFIKQIKAKVLTHIARSDQITTVSLLHCKTEFYMGMLVWSCPVTFLYLFPTPTSYFFYISESTFLQTHKVSSCNFHAILVTNMIQMVLTSNYNTIHVVRWIRQQTVMLKSAPKIKVHQQGPHPERTICCWSYATQQSQDANSSNYCVVLIQRVEMTEEMLSAMLVNTLGLHPGHFVLLTTGCSLWADVSCQSKACKCRPNR